MPDLRTNPAPLKTKRKPIVTRSGGRYVCVVCGKKTDTPLTPVKVNGALEIHRHVDASESAHHTCSAKCCRAFVKTL